MPRHRLESQHLESLSHNLGDVVVDPALWPQVMQELCDVVGATGAGLLQSDVRTSDVPVTEPVRGLFRRYFEEGWHAHDLRAARGVPLTRRLRAARHHGVDEAGLDHQLRRADRVRAAGAGGDDAVAGA